jgi:hypothetical protein
MRKVALHRAVAIAVCGLSFAVPASARAVGECPSQPVSRVFLPWSDPAWYASVPDGGMESQQGAWTLEGSAAFLTDNESYFVRSATDRWSLALPAGASAVSAPTCIGMGHPTLRLFARNVDHGAETLRIAVEFTDLVGVRRSQQIAQLTAGPSWAPTPWIPIVANALSLLSPQQVTFRFTPSGGRWRIDDVYVDPYGKG